MFVLRGDSLGSGQYDLTSLTLLTFPLREANNASGRGNVNNVKSSWGLFGNGAL